MEKDLSFFLLLGFSIFSLVPSSWESSNGCLLKLVQEWIIADEIHKTNSTYLSPHIPPFSNSTNIHVMGKTVVSRENGFKSLMWESPWHISRNRKRAIMDEGEGR